MWTMGVTVVSYSIFVYIPMFYGLIVSFFNWNPFQSVFDFVGWGNYAYVLKNPDFWNAIKNTCLFTIGSLILTIGTALVLAAVMQMIRRGAGFYRAVYFLPVISAMVASCMLWKFLFGYNDGFFNAALMQMGFVKVPWLQNPHIAMLCVIVVQAWKDVGYALILILAGINNIDPGICESAEIDGCSKLKQFILITMPLIKNTMTILIITKLIDYMQVYTPIKFITEGGPGKATETIAFYIFEEAFSLYNFGSASAVSFILFAIIFAFSLIQLKVNSGNT